MSIAPDIFLDAIQLLLHVPTPIHRIHAETLIKYYSESEPSVLQINGHVDKDLCNLYIGILREIIHTGLTIKEKSPLRTILLKAKSSPALEKRRDLYDLLQELFSSEEAASLQQMEMCLNRVENAIRIEYMDKQSRSIFGALNRAREQSDPVEQKKALDLVDELSGKIPEHSSKLKSTSAKPKGMVESISMSNKEQVSSGLSKQVARSVTGVIKLGLQGLNQMLGRPGGAMRGESIVFAALSHHYKSGMLNSILSWAALYNVYACGDKIPLILGISLENEAHENMVWTFRQQYRLRTGLNPDGLSEAEIVDWICDLYSKSGVELVIERHLPQEFGYDELVSRVEFFKAAGFEVIACSLDYLNCMKKGSGNKNHGNHLDVKELASKTCNYFKSEGITLFTGHQLTREAKKLVSMGVTNVVKKFGADHISDAFDLFREVDTVIYLHIENNAEGIPFLTMKIDKHRYVEDTKEAHKYCAYPFTEFGILDDINGAPGFTRDIYAYSLDGVDLNSSAPIPDRVKLDQLVEAAIF